MEVVLSWKRKRKKKLVLYLNRRKRMEKLGAFQWIFSLAFGAWHSEVRCVLGPFQPRHKSIVSRGSYLSQPWPVSSNPSTFCAGQQASFPGSRGFVGMHRGPLKLVCRFSYARWCSLALCVFCSTRQSRQSWDFSGS